MDVRVYYEDTDAAGVVYHANYIKYLERGRTEYLRDHGFSVAKLAKDGYVFPVVRLEIDFKSPARHDDLLHVETTPYRSAGASFILFQRIVRHDNGKILLEGLVTLACVTSELKVRRIPLAMRRLLEPVSSTATSRVSHCRKNL